MMDDIPQDVLYRALNSAHLDSPADFLRTVANDFRDRADKMRTLRKKGWQGASRELDTVDGHLCSYADQLAAFIANNPDAAVLVVGEDEPTDGREEDSRDTVNGETDQPAPTKGKKAKPQLPGNTERCASFRRADADDPTVCHRDRDHEGLHAGVCEGAGVNWPRTPSGHVCGDVVILHDGTALNCARPLGHDGDEHHDGRYRLWPRGVGTSRQTNICERCNTDTHMCPGCGEPIGHYAGDCGKGCTDDPVPVIPADIFPGQCISLSADERCMVPGGHTGKHKGTTGGAWVQLTEIDPTDNATLGDIAEQQRQHHFMAIPEQRPESDPVPVPAAVMVAEMKEEVSATVADLSNPFAPRPPAATTIDPSDPIHGGPTFGALSPGLATMGSMTLSGSTEPEVPIAPFLPPHLVPGTPRERYSVSSVQAMEDCGLKFRLKYRDGVAPTNIGWANVGGKAFHACVAAIELAHAQGTGWSPDVPIREQEAAASTLWKACFAAEIAKTEAETGIPSTAWRASNRGKENREWWAVSGEDMVRGYAHWRREWLAAGWTLLRKPDGTTAQELEFDVLVDGVPNKGFIDAAWINTTITEWTIRIVDYKSGATEGKPFQLKSYGHAMRSLGALGDYRVEGAFYDARKGDWTAPPMLLTPDDDAEVGYRFQSTAAADRANIFIPRPSTYCGGCEVKASCPILNTRR